MASEQKNFALIGKHMRRRAGEGEMRPGGSDMPAIADLIRRIDHALMERRAA